MFYSNKSLFGYVSDNPPITNEGSAGIVADMNTKNIHVMSRLFGTVNINPASGEY